MSIFLISFLLIIIILLFFYLILWRINTRKYISSGTVASAYDSWTQDKLLEERNTHTRLQREFEMLDHTRKQLAARTALKESFPDIKEN